MKPAQAGVAFAIVLAALLATACEPPSLPTEGDPTDQAPGSGQPVDPGPAPTDPAPPTPTYAALRLVAANLSSGNYQNYDGLEGIRIMEGLKPDVVMVQEFNYKTKSAADFQEMANLVITGSAVPASPAYYCHETGTGIPNGIISRYPILQSRNGMTPT